MTRHGMTLIELMIALAILSIVLTYSLPLGTDYFDKVRVRNARQFILHALGVGRAAALGEGREITFCGSADGSTCDYQWSHGLLLVDILQQKTLYYWSNPSKRLTIEWQGWRGDMALSISPYLTEQMLTGTFTITSGDHGEKIILNRVGRWRVVSFVINR